MLLFCCGCYLFVARLLCDLKVLIAPKVQYKLSKDSWFWYFSIQPKYSWMHGWNTTVKHQLHGGTEWPFDASAGVSGLCHSPNWQCLLFASVLCTCPTRCVTPGTAEVACEEGEMITIDKVQRNRSLFSQTPAREMSPWSCPVEIVLKLSLQQ